MHRAIVGELAREAVPLAATPEPEDDRVQGALVYAGATSLLRWIVLFEYQLDLLPQLVRHAPDRREPLLLRLGVLGHLCASSSGNIADDTRGREF
jgi:hypothetical protein